MSDKKTNVGMPSPDEPFDREFEQFLREEASRVAAIYRKLPHAEPDARLDARVHARAREGIRDEPSFASPRRIGTASRRNRRWLPAFASAAVLLLAAGIAWRLGPQNWAQKDGMAVDVTAAASKVAAPAIAPLPQPAGSTAIASPMQEAAVESGAAAANAAASAPSAARDSANTPAPLPAAKSAAHIAAPAAPSGTTPRADLTQTEAPHGEAAVSAAISRASERPAPTRATADSAGSELKKAETPEQSRAAAPTLQGAPQPATVAAPAAVAQSVPAQIPQVSTPSASPPKAPAAQAPPPPASEPVAALSAPAAASPPPATAGHLDGEAQKRAFAYRISSSESPHLSITGKPTAAQLAAWPAPNCSAPATPAQDNRSSSYPPDVPATAQLRFATVRIFLDLDSREAARKAYADFRLCHPDDRWPRQLIQQLGTQ